jgi:hypothetical protein
MPQSRHSLCRMSAIDCASKAPRSSVTVQPSLPPMLLPRFQNGRRWHTKQASSPNDNNTPARSRMSALGQKRTLPRSNGMSALPPKADIGRQPLDVRFVPKADMLYASQATT